MGQQVCPLFDFKLFSLLLYPVPLLFLSWFPIVMDAFASPFLPCCSTRSILHLRSSILRLLHSHFIPSYVFLILFSHLFLNFHHSATACQFVFTSPLSPSLCWKATPQHSNFALFSSLRVFNMHSRKVHNTVCNYLILPTWTSVSKWLLSWLPI